MRVLVVEGDVTTRQGIEEVLAYLGHDVTAVGDARAAWAAHEKAQFPLIVLDWILPGEDGLSLCRRIRGQPGGEIPVILFLTGRNQTGVLEAVLTAGGDDYLAKPFDIPSLEARLLISERQVCRRAQTRQAAVQARTYASEIEALLQTIPVAVWIAEDPACKRITCNAAADALMRRPPGSREIRTSLVDSPRVVAFRRDGREISWEENPLRYAARYGVPVRDAELELQFSDGEIRHIFGHSAPLIREDGAVRGAVAVFVDITESKRAAEQVRASETRLAEAERLAHLGYWVWEIPENRFIASDEYFRVFGLDPNSAKLTPEETRSYVHPDDLPMVMESVQRALREGSPFEIRFRIVRADGAGGFVECRGAPERASDGTVVRLMGTTQDITERKQAEEALSQAQKMEAVGLLAGGIAHDFNNLLTGIMGFTEMAMQHLHTNDPARAFLRQVIAAGQQAAALNRQLLTFSRRHVVQPELVDLNDVVARAEGLLRRLIREDIKLITRLDPDVGLIKADPVQLEQVILNLAVNARDAMPTGGTLSIKTRNIAREAACPAKASDLHAAHYARLTVSDTGVGMPPEVQARVFEPFFTTKPVGQGTGLGLATVYGIVKQCAGAITVCSEPGRGTTFSIYLPIVSETNVVRRRGLKEATVPPGTETILIVEDDSRVREIIRSVLSARGYHVLDAADPEEALQIYRERDGAINLVLTDVVMPTMSGPDLIARLTAEAPWLRVLYMSGHTADVALRHGVHTGDADFLAKPFTASTLARKVREVLDRPGFARESNEE